MGEPEALEGTRAMPAGGGFGLPAADDEPPGPSRTGEVHTVWPRTWGHEEELPPGHVPVVRRSGTDEDTTAWDVAGPWSAWLTALLGTAGRDGGDDTTGAAVFRDDDTERLAAPGYATWRRTNAPRDGSDPAGDPARCGGPVLTKEEQDAVAAEERAAAERAAEDGEDESEEEHRSADLLARDDSAWGAAPPPPPGVLG